MEDNIVKLSWLANILVTHEWFERALAAKQVPAKNFGSFFQTAKDATMLDEIRILNIYCSFLYAYARQEYGIDLKGEFVQCGVWKGGIAAAIAQQMGKDRDYRESTKLWLYDTFQGMTEPSEVDVNLVGVAASSILDEIKCESSFSEVVERVGKHIDGKRVNFVVGDVRKTLYLEGAVPEKIAFLHLDTDFYDSTKAELEVLWPRVSPGGVVVIDDYGHWKGCGKAVDEFFGSRLLQVEYREEPLRKLADDVRADPERFAEFVGVYHKVDYTAIRIFKVK